MFVTIGGMLSRRAALTLITLGLLSAMVFAGGQLLPGDVARAILGPLADARAVANLDHQLGLDRPLLIQYWQWISHFVAGRYGRFIRLSRAGRSFIWRRWLFAETRGASPSCLVVPLSICERGVVRIACRRSH